MGDGRIIGYAIGGFGLGIYLFFKGFRWRKEQLLIQTTPTSKVRSIAMGQVEVTGSARRNRQPIIAPFSGEECTYFHITVEEYRSSGKSGHWKVIHEDASTTPFFLEDETGKVLIHPVGAEMELPMSIEYMGKEENDPAHKIRDYLTAHDIAYEAKLFGKRIGLRGDLRCREYIIKDGQQLYILGYAGKRPGVKGAARNEESIMIQKGQEPYLISPKSERDVLASLKWKVFGGWFGGAALAAFCLFVIFAYFGIL